MKPLRVLVLVLFACALLPAQEAAPAAAAPASKMPTTEPEIARLVEQQFGPSFKVEFVRESAYGYKYLNPPKDFREWKPVHVGDLNNDGIQDAVIIARSEAPLVDQGGYNYSVIDPYFSAHGYGNPKITATFQTEDPRFANQAILVIHGAGPDAWWAETPLAKYVVINVPFKHVNIKKTVVKKKKPAVWAIAVQEEDQLTSAIVWDGKKYKWQPTGSAQ